MIAGKEMQVVNLALGWDIMEYLKEEQCST
jgi:hypothetical protein